MLRFALATPIAYLGGLVTLIVFSASGAQRLPAPLIGAAFLLILLYQARANRSSSLGDLRQVDAAPSHELTELWLFLLAVIASFVTTYPRLWDMGRLILGNTGDAGASIYVLEWQAHALIHDIESFFDPTIFFPERFTLAWGPFLTPLLPMYALMKAVTGNPILSFNALMVMLTFVTLAAMYAFLRGVGFDKELSAIGSLIFATTGQRLAHLGHVDSFQTFWFPVFALLIIRLWDKNRLRDALGLSCALVGSMLAAPYYFLGGLTLAGSAMLLSLRPWNPYAFKRLAIALGTTVFFSIPVLLMTRMAGLHRSVQEIFPLHWADLFHPGPFTPALSWLTQAAVEAGGGRTLENWLFPSLSLAIFAAIGGYKWLGARANGRELLPPDRPAFLPSLLIISAVVGAVMSLGPYLVWNTFRIPLPMLALRQLPGFESIRATGRFVALIFLSLTVLGVLGLQAIRRRMPKKPAKIWVYPAAAFVVISSLTFHPLTAIDLTGPPVEVNKALARKAKAPVVELPWPACPGLGCLYTEPPRMMWSRYDWFPRLGGYSGHIPDYWAPATEALRHFPESRSIRFLSRLQVHYVILRVNAGVNGDHFTAGQAAKLASMARERPEVESVERFGADYLITLRQTETRRRSA